MGVDWDWPFCKPPTRHSRMLQTGGAWWPSSCGTSSGRCREINTYTTTRLGQLNLTNVIITLINHPWLGMVYSNYLWWWLGDGLGLLYPHDFEFELILGDILAWYVDHLGVDRTWIEHGCPDRKWSVMKLMGVFSQWFPGLQFPPSPLVCKALSLTAETRFALRIAFRVLAQPLFFLAPI